MATDILQAFNQIHEKLAEAVEKGQFSNNSLEQNRLILDNQLRLSEALLIIGTTLKLIVDDNIQIQLDPPPKKDLQ